MSGAVAAAPELPTFSLYSAPLLPCIPAVAGYAQHGFDTKLSMMFIGKDLLNFRWAISAACSFSLSEEVI